MRTHPLPAVLRRVLLGGLRATWLVFAGATAIAQDRQPVVDARPLFAAAIDAADGRAHGVLVGEFADAVTRRFGGTTPIHIDVSTEYRFAQPGCSRLRVDLWQDGVLLPGAPDARRQTVTVGVSVCREGGPPPSPSRGRPA